MTILVSVSDPRDNLVLQTLYASGVERSIVDNDIGTASFHLPLSLPNLETAIRWGSIYRIHERGFPTWVGYAETLNFNSYTVELNLRSAEGLLGGYITDQGLRLGADGRTTSAQIAKALVDSALGNAPWTPFKAGVFTGPAIHYVEHDYTKLPEALSKLAELDKGSWWVDDKLQIHYAAVRGGPQYNGAHLVTLEQDIDLVDVTYRETRAEVVTNILGLGAGNDIVSKPKLLRQLPSEDFVWAEVKNYASLVDSNSLERPVREDLHAAYLPKGTVDGKVLNTRGAYDYLGIGNIFRVLIKRGGRVIETRCKILGLERSEGEAIRCVFETIQDTTGLPEPSLWRIS